MKAVCIYSYKISKNKCKSVNFYADKAIGILRGGGVNFAGQADSLLQKSMKMIWITLCP